MEPRNIIISLKAQRSYDHQCFWYLKYCGFSYVQTFEEDIKSTLTALSLTPSIGRKIKYQRGYQYCTYVNHPRCFVFYAYNDKEVKILNFVFTNTSYTLK